MLLFSILSNISLVSSAIFNSNSTVRGLMDHQQISRLEEDSRQLLLQYSTVTETGNMPQNIQEDLNNQIKVIKQQKLSREQYQHILQNSGSAVNVDERLASVSGRKVFIIVDTSGTLMKPDDTPTYDVTTRESTEFSATAALKRDDTPDVAKRTRWESALLTATSLTEVALSMDSGNAVQLLFLNGDRQPTSYTVTEANSVSDVFQQQYPPQSTQPLVHGLTAVYIHHLRKVLADNKPFTCIVLTDREHEHHSYEVSLFFRAFVKKHQLNSPGRENLASFSFVRMGNDYASRIFFRYLYHILTPEMREMGMMDLIHTHSSAF